VVQPLHRNTLITPTRCDPLLAAPSRDWRGFQQSFADPWEPFQHAHPRYQTAYYEGLVAKMLGCGNAETMGYVEYRCLPCGQGKHLWVDACFRKYPNGVVTNVQKGQVPSQDQSVTRYVAKYVVSPPSAVRRIDRYDGEWVTYHYRSHRTDYYHRPKSRPNSPV
jgi:hypothetical protein